MMTDQLRAMGILTGAELVAKYDAEDKAWRRQKRSRIGNAVWNKKDRCIELFDDAGRFMYDIDLDRCKSAEAVLNWILHVHQKTWMTPQMMKDMLDMMLRVIPSNVLFHFGAE
jgi:hypothetical protein